MVYPNLLNGISSLSFSLIPYLFNTPTFVQTRLNILSMISSTYHIISEYRVLKNVEKNEKNEKNENNKLSDFTKRFFEGIDGSSIILLCNPFIFNITKNFHNIDISILLFYLSTKLTSDLEIVKKIIYMSTHAKIMCFYPELTIPHIFAQISFYKQYITDKPDKCDKYGTEIWDPYNRYIWHINNAIFIGFGMKYLYIKKNN